MELGKTEIADSEILGFDSKEYSFGGTFLAETAIRSDKELLLESNRHLFDISKDDFESLWDQVITVAGNVNRM